MSVPGYAHGIQTSFLATMNARAQAARQAEAASPVHTVKVTSGAATAQSGDQGAFLNDVLDVINPLQHIPVVSTLYRAATGDKIGDVERVAGDTLYGGLMGLGSSLANLIFKDVTGKDFGDTVLAWLDGGDSGAKPAAVAAAPTATVKLADATSNVAAEVTPAQPTMLADPQSFLSALKAKGVDPVLGMRAMRAYQKSLGLTAGAAVGAAQP